jgi:hypothetical protein
MSGDATIEVQVRDVLGACVARLPGRRALRVVQMPRLLHE